MPVPRGPRAEHEGDAGQGVVAVHELRGDGQRDPVRAALRRGELPARLRAAQVRESSRPCPGRRPACRSKSPRCRNWSRRSRPDADDQAALRQVLDYYHARLKENPAALAYLKNAGSGARRRSTTFQAGLRRSHAGTAAAAEANRKEGAAMRERLTRLGSCGTAGTSTCAAGSSSRCVAENGGDRDGLRPRDRRRGQARPAPVFAGAAARACGTRPRCARRR